MEGNFIFNKEEVFMKKKLFCMILVFSMIIPTLAIPAAESCQHEWSDGILRLNLHAVIPEKNPAGVIFAMKARLKLSLQQVIIYGMTGIP